MRPLPAGFVERMSRLLGPEAQTFLASLDAPPTRAVRANVRKVSLERLVELLVVPLDPVPWCPSASFLPPGARLGREPVLAAGLLYVQDPSALAVAEALAIEPHHRVLDFAAAPGGKATHCASFLGEGGLLVANETERARLPQLVQNLDRWGYPNVAILSASAPELAAIAGPFDRVLVDAPCSGEGMFRKDAEARAEWSPAHVRGSAARQARLLATAAQTVAGGGLLAYSTCTFAPEENEGQVEGFLSTHTGWELVDVSRLPGAEPGRPEWCAGGDEALGRTARLWPHRCRGEGHFVALLRAPAAPAAPPTRTRSAGREPNPRRVVEGFRRFASESLRREPPADRLWARGDRLFLLPPGLPDALRGRAARPGLLLGVARPGRFEPAHALALALAPGAAAQAERVEGEELEAFLRGGQVARSGPRGWVLVTYLDWPVGWGYRADGAVLKSRVPRALRLTPTRWSPEACW